MSMTYDRIERLAYNPAECSFLHIENLLDDDFEIEINGLNREYWSRIRKFVNASCYLFPNQTGALEEIYDEILFQVFSGKGAEIGWGIKDIHIDEGNELRMVLESETLSKLEDALSDRARASQSSRSPQQSNPSDLLPVWTILYWRGLGENDHLFFKCSSSQANTPAYMIYLADNQLTLTIQHNQHKQIFHFPSTPNYDKNDDITSSDVLITETLFR